MLGSQYFVTHPTIRLSNIVAAINMDMYLPLFALHYLEVQGLGESTLGNDIRAVAQKNAALVRAELGCDRRHRIESVSTKYLRGFCFVLHPQAK
jgi:hypothetical protein